MNQFCVPNRLKAMKKTSSGLIGNFTLKPSNFYLISFLMKIFYFFCFFNSPRDKSLFLSRFDMKPPFIITNFFYSQMKPNEQKNCFQGIDHVFWLRL